MVPNIDPEQVRKLAGWGLTQNDRASFVGWSPQPKWMWAKGYKFYAIWGGRPVRETYRVYRMNTSEDKVGEEMIPELHGGGYLLGDGEYDANVVFFGCGPSPSSAWVFNRFMTIGVRQLKTGLNKVMGRNLIPWV